MSNSEKTEADRKILVIETDRKIGPDGKKTEDVCRVILNTSIDPETGLECVKVGHTYVDCGGESKAQGEGTTWGKEFQWGKSKWD